MDRPWKAEERQVARLLGGERYPGNSGGRVDVEGPRYVAQVKHRRCLSLAELEALAMELEQLGNACGKAGVVVVVKRRAGKGTSTPRLIVMTDNVWRAIERSHGNSGTIECQDASEPVHGLHRVDRRCSRALRPSAGRRSTTPSAPCRVRAHAGSHTSEARTGPPVQEHALCELAAP
jgi:hypothetical protein